MLSFINEIDDPIVQQDILDLNRRILRFREGTIDEERFRSLRLARGVYGQRQPGVQMIRIKVPMGLLSFDQFRTILDVCDEYSTGKYHLTTRQDIQIHHVKLEDSPELWAKLERSQVTLREACGNTVRNVTASPMAGIDPEEPFNVLPWADVPDRCDFFMGGIVTNGSLKIAISTDGKAPILAKRMREWLEDVLPHDVEESLDDLLQLRRELKGDFATKQATLRAMTSHFRNNPKGRAV